VKRSAWLIPTASVVLVIVIWELLERGITAAHPAVPAPSAIVGAFGTSGRVLWLNLQPTVFEAVLGFICGSLAGVLLAIGLFAWRSAEGALYKVVVTVHSVPLLAIAPLLVIWMGIGPSPVIALAALACFFPTTVNVHTGLQAVGAADLELMQSINARPGAVLLHLRLPAALPYLLAALKIGAPSAVLGATIGEWLGSRGLGYVMFSSMVNFQPPLLWAAMLLSALLSLAGFVLFAVLERTLVSWHESVRSTESRA
jgi:NitT/TauT family transport system permease protein